VHYDDSVGSGVQFSTRRAQRARPLSEGRPAPAAPVRQQASYRTGAAHPHAPFDAGAANPAPALLHGHGGRHLAAIRPGPAIDAGAAVRQVAAIRKRAPVGQWVVNDGPIPRREDVGPNVRRRERPG